jgi:hypothetical protein
MALDERQLSVLLQASVDFARQLLLTEGGFAPFGARARPDGEVEFVQLPAKGESDLELIYKQIGTMLAAEAREGAILGAALVTNTRVHGLADAGFHTAMVVIVETPGYSRSITVPYRLVPSDGGPARVELGRMIPDEGEPVLFPVLS